MAGLNAITSKMKYLNSISIAKTKGRQVSVVYFDEINGEPVTDWPENPAAGVLCVPRKMTEDEWQATYNI